MMWTRETDIRKVRGVEVHSWYSGCTCYAAFIDGEEVYNGCSLDELIAKIGFNPYK